MLLRHPYLTVGDLRSWTKFNKFNNSVNIATFHRVHEIWAALNLRALLV